MEGEKGRETAKNGSRGGGRGRGECSAYCRSTGKWILSSCTARAREDEREAAQKNILQEEQNGQCRLLGIFKWEVALAWQFCSTFVTTENVFFM